MLNLEQAAVVKGMLARGDKQHDIAAHFGTNSGRVAEISTGAKFSNVPPAPANKLPAPKVARFIDPNASAEKQYEQLREFIDHPPENSRTMVITPALAALVLDRLNTNNRKKRTANIRRFAEAMTRDNWVLTGDTIKFSRTGLLDGQNRLAGCVRAGKKFRTHVVFGIAEDAFSRIDAGAGRTNPDTFQIAGVPYCAIAAPAVRWIMIGNERGRKVENQELLEHYNQHIDADQMTEACKSAAAVGKVLPHGALAAHLYLFSQKNERLAAQFANDLINRKRGARKLIDKVIRIKRANMGRINELQVNALLILAWNAYRANKTPDAKTLLWTEAKEFPTIA